MPRGPGDEPIEETEPEPEPVEEEAPVIVAEAPKGRVFGGFNKGEYLSFPNRASENKNFRSRKIVKPQCQVPDVQEYKGAFKTNMSTGPCQQQIIHEPRREFDWWKTCTHGPAFTSTGQPIPENERCYYTQTIEYIKRPKSVGEDGQVEWEEFEVMKVVLNVADVSLDIRHNSGRAMEYWQARGGRPVETFGLRTYCEYRGCFEQDLKQFSNGGFHTRREAALVKIYELGDILPIPWDRMNQGERPSFDRREKMIREAAV